ncbi:transcription termination factor 1-like [Entelurus aequoreus]|uniref:transcription termination factor 1-like n=1 Tax=Entelurus aequoreus TaxID=161455 RepID=UPI002B1E1A93|nr:transcription termination factor 1-like [Entelurus aequoreus]
MSVEADCTHKKRARSEVATLDHIDTPPMKKKKKKKREKEKDSPVVAEVCTDKKKKKKKREKEEEKGSLGSVCKKKKKKEETAPPVTMATIQVETRKMEKKKKRKRGLDGATTTAGQTVAMDVVDTQTQEDNVVTATANSGEGNICVEKAKKSKKKKAKRRREEVCESDNDDDDDDRPNGDLLTELEEFIPNVRKRTEQEIRKMLKHDLHRFRVFRKQGVAVRQGRFTRHEVQQIQDNIEDFLALTGIESANQLYFPQNYGDLKMGIRRLRVNHNFLEAIANGIPRTCWEVFVKAKKLDKMNHMGRFSKEELDQLVTLQKFYGNNWRKISKLMDRSIYALQKRSVTMSSNLGPWTPDEVSKLKKAVKAYLAVVVQKNPAGSGLTREQLCNKLPWRKISLEVQTRDWLKCRRKWFSILNLRLSKTYFGGGTEGVKAKIHLIDTLYNMEVDDCADVDWDKVAEVVGMTPRGVQEIFQRLKVSRVPNWFRLSYGEIIDFLHQHERPRLQETLQKLGAEQEVHGRDFDPLLAAFSLEEEDFTQVDNSQRHGNQSQPFNF